MAIRGYWDTDEPSAPYIRSTLYVPGLRLVAEVDFLVDTGADATSLHPYDVSRTGIDPSTLPGTLRTASGIGGQMRYIEAGAFVYLYDTEASDWHRFPVLLAVSADAPPDPSNRIPSVLGRDVLNDCLCTFDSRRESVTLEPYERESRLVRPA